MDIQLRFSAVDKFLASSNLDALFITSVSTIRYLSGYAGFSTEEREGYMLLTKKKKYIFTDGRYADAIRDELPEFTLIETRSKSPFLKNLEAIIQKTKIESVGLELDDLRVSEYKALSPLFTKKRVISLAKLREKKDMQEIKIIKNACQIGDKTFEYILKRIKEDHTEKQIAAEMEFVMSRYNAESSFRTIVASGSNAAIPHHLTSNKKIHKNNFLLFDFGVRFENYCSDMTRTIFVGHPSPRHQLLYKTVLEAQQIAVEYIQTALSKGNPVKASEADLAARRHIISLDYPSIPHSLGHGIGIDVHELPRLSPGSESILTEGMVFSIEPGIYLPDVGGVRIEDLFTIQKNKLVQLTKSPKEELITLDF